MAVVCPTARCRHLTDRINAVIPLSCWCCDSSERKEARKLFTEERNLPSDICRGRIRENPAMEAIKSKEDFEKASANSLKGFLVVHFFSASWSPECSQMEDVIKEVVNDYQKTKFFRIEAEELEDISLQYGVSSVPTFVFLLGKATQEKMQGADPPKFLQKVQELQKRAETACLGDEPSKSTTASSAEESLNNRLRRLIELAPVTIFMKGEPQQPRCGFSRKAIEMLAKHKVKFAHFDILTDNDVREGLKKYSNWPSYPQLYVNGELVGGVDIMTQMDEDGSLKTLFEEAESGKAN